MNQLNSNLSAIQSVVNGGIDSSNLSPSVALADTQLASPNNSVYRTVHAGIANVNNDLATGTYLIGGSGGAVASGGNVSVAGAGTVPMFMFRFDSADYTVAGKTTKLRLRAQIANNATAWSSVTATVGMYPLTFAGGADIMTCTVGTVVSGSTVALANPGASTVTQGNSGDFDVPSAGQYGFAFVMSATLTNNAASTLAVQLQMRHV